jgi:hypothetical protein
MCIIMGRNVFGQQQNVSGLLLTHFNRASGQAWEQKCSSTCVLPALKTCCWFVVGVGTMLPATAVLVYCLHLRAAADLSSGWVPHTTNSGSEWVTRRTFACEITNLFIGTLIFALFLMTTWPIITWRKKTDKLVGSHKKNIIYIKY